MSTLYFQNNRHRLGKLMEILIQHFLPSQVREKPFLYNDRHPDYKNRNIKENGWNAIGTKLGKSGMCIVRIYIGQVSTNSNYKIYYI